MTHSRKSTSKKAQPPAVAETLVPLRLEYLDPAQLDENPANWRTHPAKQVAALEAAMAEVGWAGALLYNERTQRLVDGHARRKLFAGKGKVPVLIGSWDEATEKKILATLDPLAAMAEANKDALDSLLRDVQTGSEAVAGMLTELAAANGILPGNDVTAPEEFPAVDENIETEHQCPKCGYAWSGKPS